jgi:DNA helicase-2/ATP-dependent DNA helicase PcrA
MSIETIDSKTIVADFDSHIKVSAGPGAGKTEWLIGHMINVLNKSEKLGISRKIACITYTNIGVETIVKRLGDGAHRVEVSTIHAFLYKHVLKPYAHFLPASYELAAGKIKGHDDKIVSGYQFLKDWKARTGQQRITDDAKVRSALKALKWSFDASGALVVKTPFPVKIGSYSIKNDSYLVYKKMTWAKGIIHHDDVLYLSFELIRLFPFILEVLRAKFPYFCIDEFQDISPIQLSLLKEIIQKETKVCIVGDNAQSIYSFMGAVPDQFVGFSAPGMKSFKIDDNWRSTEKIVDLLNLVRRDLVQKGMRGAVGNPPVIVVGNKLSALSLVASQTMSRNLCTLTRDNLLANAVRKGLSINVGEDLIDKLSELDSNSERRRAIVRCAKAIEYAQQGFFKDALKETAKMHGIDDEHMGKKKSLEILKQLVNGKASFVDGTLMDFYNFINSSGISTLAKPSKDPLRNFMLTSTYSDFSAGVKALDEALPFRTIHKSKGDEFDAVLIVVSPDKNGIYKENQELAFLLAPDLSNEEHRIKYVAMSRAMNHLYINLPELSSAAKARLETIGFVVV